eukprot:gene11121-3940_t
MGIKCLYHFFKQRKSAPGKSVPKNCTERSILWKAKGDIEKLVKEYYSMDLEEIEKFHIGRLSTYWYLLSKGGKMVPEEFGAFLEDSFPNAVDDSGCLSFLFRAMDPDLSGEIDPHEFIDLALGLAQKFSKEKNAKIWFNFFDSDANGVLTNADIEDCISFFKTATGMTQKEAEEFSSTLKKYNDPEKKVVTLDTFNKLMNDGVKLYGFDIMKKNIFTI